MEEPRLDVLADAVTTRWCPVSGDSLSCCRLSPPPVGRRSRPRWRRLTGRVEVRVEARLDHLRSARSSPAVDNRWGRDRGAVWQGHTHRRAARQLPSAHATPGADDPLRHWRLRRRGEGPLLAPQCIGCAAGRPIPSRPMQAVCRGHGHRRGCHAGAVGSSVPDPCQTRGVDGTTASVEFLAGEIGESWSSLKLYTCSFPGAPPPGRGGGPHHRFWRSPLRAPPAARVAHHRDRSMGPHLRGIRPPGRSLTVAVPPGQIRYIRSPARQMSVRLGGGWAATPIGSRWAVPPG